MGKVVKEWEYDGYSCEIMVFDGDLALYIDGVLCSVYNDVPHDEDGVLRTIEIMTHHFLENEEYIQEKLGKNYEPVKFVVEQ